MAVEQQLNQIASMYSDNLSQHGEDSKAVGWNTASCQTLRFKQLCKVLPESGQFSVLDYGCGYGALLDFIETDNHKTVSEYIGYDISAEMLEQAKRHLCDKASKIKTISSSDINQDADFGFVSGTFNVKFDASNEQWQAFIESALEQLNRHCKKGFAFNLLSTYVDWQESHLFYGDPCFWFDYCKKHFSKQVTLFHDYPLWEWTIIVRKENA